MKRQEKDSKILERNKQKMTILSKVWKSLSVVAIIVITNSHGKIRSL